MAVTTFDKLLVTHSAALRRKYGAAGLTAVRAALDRLVAADQARGLRTKVLLLDNARSMAAIKAERVPEGDWVSTLKAVDLAATRYAPAYLALVGATDVVPQAEIANPVAGDPDPWIPSDLPFACDLPDTWTGPSGRRLQAADLLAVTRVVGRIPDLPGERDPAMLLAALATAARYTQRTARSYQKVFALTASVWKGSTLQSVDLLPGPAPTTHLSPPEDAGWTKRELAGLTHFVNCHGGDTTPDWFGQAPGGAVDTVALRPEDVAGRIAEGTVVAAECCYGALHLAPADIGGRIPLMWAYLGSGGYAGYGSSTTAYGPADGNGQADLVCRFVLAGVLSGASTGRALLDARQRYVRESGALNPVDLKTLAQFDLLGDPSVVPVALPDRTPPKGAHGQALASPTLGRRRSVLAAAGRALSTSVPRAGRPRGSEVDAVALAREAGLRVSQVAGAVTSYGEHAGAPRGGFRYHVLPVRSGERGGLVLVEESDGARRTSTVWRK